MSSRDDRSTTEVVLDEGDGMPTPVCCQPGQPPRCTNAMLTEHVTDLDLIRMREVCQALAVAVGCDA